MRRLLHGVGAEFQRHDFVMVGSVAGHPVATAMEKVWSIGYGSRLYDVTFWGCTPRWIPWG